MQAGIRRFFEAAERPGTQTRRQMPSETGFTDAPLAWAEDFPAGYTSPAPGRYSRILLSGR